MAFAGPVTRGYSASGHLDGSIALMVRDGYQTGVTVKASLATFGFGTGGSLSTITQFGYRIISGPPVPPGKQYILVANLPWPANALSILMNATPTVYNGCYMMVDLFSTPGNYPVTVFPDGTFKIAANGDTARQSFVSDVFDPLFQFEWGSFTTWVNNTPPTQPNQESFEVDLNLGDTFSVDLNTLIRDIDGDVITYTAPQGLPPGFTLNGSLIGGIPQSAGGFNPTIQATDITGEFNLVHPVNVQVTDVLIMVEATADGWADGVFHPKGDKFFIHGMVEFSDSTVSIVPPGNPDYPVYGWMKLSTATTEFDQGQSLVSVTRNYIKRTVL